MVLASHALKNPQQVTKDVKTLADAYFALHAKAVARALGVDERQGS